MENKKDNLSMVMKVITTTIMLLLMCYNNTMAENSKTSTSEKVLLASLYGLITTDVVITAKNLNIRDEQGNYKYWEYNPVVRTIAGRDEVRIYACGLVGAAAATFACKKIPKESRLGFLVILNALEVFAVYTWVSDNY